MIIQKIPYNRVNDADDTFAPYANDENISLQEIPGYGFDMGATDLKELSDSVKAIRTATGGSFDNSKGYIVGGTLPKLWISSLSVNKNLFTSTETLATQSVNLPAGTYTFGFESGAGSITSSNGTGTATGHGAVSAGDSRTITVTGAGTIDFTASGTVQQAMLNSGSNLLNYQPRVGATTVQPQDFGTENSSISFNNGTTDDMIVIDSTRSYFKLSSTAPKNLTTGYEPGALFSGTNPITVTAWVNFDATGSSEFIINKGSEIVLRKEVSDRPEFILNGFTTNDRATGSTALSASTWYQLAGTFDGTTIKVFINGVEDGTATPTGTYSLVAQNFTVGGTNEPNCKFDGGTVYDTALSAADLLAIFNAEKGYYGL